MTGMTPATLEPGMTRTLTFTGKGLGAVSSLVIMPNTGLTLGAFVSSVDGNSLTVDVTADISAPRSPRAAILKTAAGLVQMPMAGSNLLYVGSKPEITSHSPSLQTVGNTFTLTVNGNNLDGASTIRFEPPEGMLVLNPPTINAGGTIATVTVVIDGMAAGGQRVVVIEGPYGSSGTISGPNNTFTVNRPVVTGSAEVRKSASVSPSRAGTFPVADSSGSSSLLALLGSIVDAIPVVRKALEFNTDESLSNAGIEKITAFGRAVCDHDRAPSLKLLSVIGWGYRGPPVRAA
jgi:hypothetical protein